MILKEQLGKQQVFCPCIYDCITAKVAEDSGFGAALVSGGGIAYSWLGLPDLAMLTADDIVRATERIAACVKIPLVVDTDDGYGESPVVVYRTVKRLAEAGAQAVTIDDSTGIRGFERYIYADMVGKSYYQRVVSRKAWLTKIVAAVEACKGTDCFVIARTECYSQYGKEEMRQRLVLSRKAGAMMTLVCDGMENEQDAHEIAAYDGGWKMWPDYYSVDGKPSADIDALKEMGFNLVTMHVFEKAALYGMFAKGKKFIEVLK